MEGTFFALYSVIFCSIANVFRDFLYFCMLTRFLPTSLRYIALDDSCIDDDEGNGIMPLRCERDISVKDVKVVVESLGMGSVGEEVRWREGVDELLEEKEASFEELKEAFYVFDWNEDGFITPGELWCVMRRLGMSEGVMMQDCVRMVSAFDEDGDGKISFLEFKRLLENAL